MSDKLQLVEVARQTEVLSDIKKWTGLT